MSEIKRYEYYNANIEQRSDGRIVFYTDHLADKEAALAEKEVVNEGLRDNKRYLENELVLKTDERNMAIKRGVELCGQLNDQDEQIAALTKERDELKRKRQIWEERNVSLEIKYAALTKELSKSVLREKMLADKWGKECLELGMEKEALTAENKRLWEALRGGDAGFRCLFRSYVRFYGVKN